MFGRCFFMFDIAVFPYSPFPECLRCILHGDFSGTTWEANWTLRTKWFTLGRGNTYKKNSKIIVRNALEGRNLFFRYISMEPKKYALMISTAAFLLLIYL